VFEAHECAPHAGAFELEAVEDIEGERLPGGVRALVHARMIRYFGPCMEARADLQPDRLPLALLHVNEDGLAVALVGAPRSPKEDGGPLGRRRSTCMPHQSRSWCL
jgi:hypothetical protein